MEELGHSSTSGSTEAEFRYRFLGWGSPCRYVARAKGSRTPYATRRGEIPHRWKILRYGPIPPLISTVGSTTYKPLYKPLHPKDSRAHNRAKKHKSAERRYEKKHKSATEQKLVYLNSGWSLFPYIALSLLFLLIILVTVSSLPYTWYIRSIATSAV